MVSAIERKQKTVTKPGFRRFRENWLLIYDNWPLPHIDATVAARYLLERLKAMASVAFESIHIVNDHTAWEFGADVFKVRTIAGRRPPNPPRRPRRR